jgi:hypothetical protein
LGIAHIAHGDHDEPMLGDDLGLTAACAMLFTAWHRIAVVDDMGGWGYLRALLTRRRFR